MAALILSSISLVISIPRLPVFPRPGIFGGIMFLYKDTPDWDFGQPGDEVFFAFERERQN
jgi:hypothetical protein